MAGTANLKLRVRTKKGVLRIENLNSSSTLLELKNSISQLTGLEQGQFKILMGYPPKQINNLNESSTLSQNSIKDGELFTLEESLSNSTSSSSSVKSVEPIPKKQIEDKGALLRKVVPADNSCLFTSVNYVMQNGVLDLNCQKSMRELIAKTVKNDPVNFNEAILGKKNSAYCDWIRESSSWGGSIEIMILSKYYKCEICVVDIRTGRIDCFGEDCAYSNRVFIIYDGIHFDPLHLEFANGKVQTKFTNKEEWVMYEAIKMANECKKARQFTDVNNFKLRCLVCQEPLVGEKSAQDHAKATGHINFGEF